MPTHIITHDTGPILIPNEWVFNLKLRQVKWLIYGYWVEVPGLAIDLGIFPLIGKRPIFLGLCSQQNWSHQPQNHLQDTILDLNQKSKKWCLQDSSLSSLWALALVKSQRCGRKQTDRNPIPQGAGHGGETKYGPGIKSKGTHHKVCQMVKAMKRSKVHRGDREPWGSNISVKSCRRWRSPTLPTRKKPLVSSLLNPKAGTVLSLEFCTDHSQCCVFLGKFLKISMFSFLFRKMGMLKLTSRCCED